MALKLVCTSIFVYTQHNQYFCTYTCSTGVCGTYVFSNFKGSQCPASGYHQAGDSINNVHMHRDTSVYDYRTPVVTVCLKIVF